MRFTEIYPAKVAFSAKDYLLLRVIFTTLTIRIFKEP